MSGTASTTSPGFFPSSALKGVPSCLYARRLRAQAGDGGRAESGPFMSGDRASTTSPGFFPSGWLKGLPSVWTSAIGSWPEVRSGWARTWIVGTPDGLASYRTERRLHRAQNARVGGGLVGRVQADLARAVVGDLAAPAVVPRVVVFRPAQISPDGASLTALNRFADTQIERLVHRGRICAARGSLLNRNGTCPAWSIGTGARGRW